MQKLLLVIGLGRFFALPATVCGVLLGVALGGYWGWSALWITLSATFLMAYAHTFNTFLDYAWTGLDKGTEEERSRGKVYTKGQQVIAAGKMSAGIVLLVGLIYAVISVVFLGFSIFTLPDATATSGWIFAVLWFVTSLCTFFYSWGKLHFLCETALGLGFGPFAVMLGMATQPHPDFLRAFLAGMPFLVIWGFAAEFVDQAIDAEPNLPRGLKNLGAMAWKNYVSIPLFTGFLFAMAYIVQMALILGGVIAPLTGLSLVAFPLVAYGLVMLCDRKDRLDPRQMPSFEFSKVGVMLLLLAVFVHMAGFLAGQILG